MAEGGINLGESGNVSPTESSDIGKVLGKPTGQQMEYALHTPVKTLGDLKRILIDNLGEENGTKYYNSFIKSFSMLMLNQIQQSARGAKKAAEQMRKQNRS